MIHLPPKCWKCLGFHKKILKQNQSLSVTTKHLQWLPTSQTNHHWQMASKEVAHLSCSPLATATKLTLFSRGNNNNPQKLPLYLSSRLLSQTSENSRCYQKSNLRLSTLTLPIKLTFTNEPLKFCLNSIPREDVQYPYSLQVFEHPPQLCLTSCFVLFLSKVQLYC